MSIRTKLTFAIGIALGAGLLALGYFSMQGGFSARGTPSWLEAFVARKVRLMAIPSDAKNERNPYQSTPEVLTEARLHFADHCAICHGNDGSGDTAIGKNLYPKVPDMRQPATQELTEGAIYYIIQNGIRLTGMPAWGEADGEDEDSWKLVLFIRHLPQLTPEEEIDMEQYNPKSAAQRTEEEKEEEFLRGGNQPDSNTQHQHTKEK